MSVVNARSARADANNVSIDAATQADLIETTLPRPRASEDVPADVALQVREWRRLGRHCLFVEAADGRTVGILNVNNGEATLTNEKERPRFEAAIAGWFAEAIEAPALEQELTLPQDEPEPEPHSMMEETAMPTVEDSPEPILTVELVADETPEPVAAESQTGFRAAARAKARREGPGAGVRARFARILEEYTDEAKRNRPAIPEQAAAPAQEQLEVEEPEAPVAPAAPVAVAASRGRHRGLQGDGDPLSRPEPRAEAAEHTEQERRPAGRHRAR